MLIITNCTFSLTSAVYCKPSINHILVYTFYIIPDPYSNPWHSSHSLVGSLTCQPRHIAGGWDGSGSTSEKVSRLQLGSWGSRKHHCFCLLHCWSLHYFFPFLSFEISLQMANSLTHNPRLGILRRYLRANTAGNDWRRPDANLILKCLSLTSIFFLLFSFSFSEKSTNQNVLDDHGQACFLLTGLWSTMVEKWGHKLNMVNHGWLPTMVSFKAWLTMV
jgi:hypothetical protein